jgi:hypothetical protein
MRTLLPWPFLDDIPRIMEIFHGIHENRLRDPRSVTAADCAGFIDRAEMWVWEDGQIQGFSAGDPRDGSFGLCSLIRPMKALVLAASCWSWRATRCASPVLILPR